MDQKGKVSQQLIPEIADKPSSWDTLSQDDLARFADFFSILIRIDQKNKIKNSLPRGEKHE